MGYESMRWKELHLQVHINTRLLGGIAFVLTIHPIAPVHELLVILPSLTLWVEEMVDGIGS